MSANSMSKTLTVSCITTIICYFVFELTKRAVNSSMYGAIPIKVADILFVIPTAVLTSTLIALLVYGVLSSFLTGIIEPEIKGKSPKISRRIQVLALTLIVFYSSNKLQEEVLQASKFGVMQYQVSPGFTFVIPSVVLITVILTWLVFIIMMEFASSLSGDYAIRHSEGIRKVSGAIFRKKA